MFPWRLQPPAPVNAKIKAINHPLKARRVFLRGPKTDGAFAPEPPIKYRLPPHGGATS